MAATPQAPSRATAQPIRRILVVRGEILDMPNWWNWLIITPEKVNGHTLPNIVNYRTGACKSTVHHCAAGGDHAIKLACFKTKGHMIWCLVPVLIDGEWWPCLQRGTALDGTCTDCKTKGDLIDRIAFLQARGPIALPFKKEDLFPEAHAADQAQEREAEAERAAARARRMVPVATALETIFEENNEAGKDEDVVANVVDGDQLRLPEVRTEFGQPAGDENADPEDEEPELYDEEPELYDEEPWTEYQDLTKSKYKPDKEKAKSRKEKEAEAKAAKAVLQESAKNRISKKLQKLIKRGRK